MACDGKAKRHNAIVVRGRAIASLNDNDVIAT
jgi:hypothetical protein